MTNPGALLIPQKDLDLAKSRLHLAPSRRRELAVAMLRHTVRAATAARFTAVLVVLDNPDDAGEVADLDAVPFHPGVVGLNDSLTAAEEAVRMQWGPVPLTVMPSDLALATPALLDRSLRWAARYERAFIPDSSGRGTTMLFAQQGAPLRPAYGPRSAAAHQQQGAHRLVHEALGLLQHDVDDVADVAVANLRFEERERWEETA
jgi:2-phospho-L-lactate guanylyltransferase